MSDITEEMLDEFRSRYASDREARVLSAAMAKTDMADLAYVPASAALLRGAFPVEVKTRGITAQQKSGRCWLFAALNILREHVAEACGLGCPRTIWPFTISLRRPTIFWKWPLLTPMSRSMGSLCVMSCRA